MDLILGTRLDITFAVSYLSRFMAKPISVHMTAAKRVFRYLNGTQNLELAGDLATRRLTSSYIFNLGSSAISWSLKRQPIVALSSCKAKYIRKTQVTKEAIWLRRLLGELLEQGEQPTATVIFGDN